jgi:hypothetical protein
VNGAALIQIAEHPLFTAINSLSISNAPVRNSYKINAGIGVHLKYASKPATSLDEYPFTFNQKSLRDLAEIRKVVDKLFERDTRHRTCGPEAACLYQNTRQAKDAARSAEDHPTQGLPRPAVRIQAGTDIDGYLKRSRRRHDQCVMA